MRNTGSKSCDPRAPKEQSSDGNYTRLVEAGRLNPQLLEPVLAVIGTRDMSADDLQDDVEALDMDEGVRTCSKRTALPICLRGAE